MYKLIIAGLFAFFFSLGDMLFLFKASFVQQQLEYPRVKGAKALTEHNLKEDFKTKGLAYPPKKLFMRVFKSENALEVWTLNKDTHKYDLVKTYPICAMSGLLGPKEQQGDRQVPEGFYHTTYFNPKSQYHLSMKINYPNKADRKRSQYKNLGGDIFIHGDCASLGCVSITDPAMNELYWLSTLVRNNGQKHIPVHIFPAQLANLKYNILCDLYEESPELTGLWTQLQAGYDYFENNRVPPKVRINRKGEYVFK